jgi:hypothetical protein
MYSNRKCIILTNEEAQYIAKNKYKFIKDRAPFWNNVITIPNKEFLKKIHPLNLVHNTVMIDIDGTI